MKIRFLGTAAAEGFPGLFCECAHCARARAAGGKNIRTRSQAVIDDQLLIDLGPDTCLHALHNGLDLTRITDLLVTHGHSDHLYAPELAMRLPGFAHITDKTPLVVHGTERSLEKVYEICEIYQIGPDTVAPSPLRPFEPFRAGRYTVTPLKADHAAHLDPVIFLIGDGTRTFLYATDTGLFPPETMDYLKAHPTHIDAMAIDCTAILLEGWTSGHMGLDSNVQMVEALKAMGVLDDTSAVIVHHFSHNGGAIHDELVPIAARHGFLVSYDGMELTI